MILPRKGCTRDFFHSLASFRCTGWTDRHVPRVAPEASQRLGEANGQQAPMLWNLVEVCDAFPLCEVVVHKPGLAFQAWSHVSIQRLVTVKQNLAVSVQELESLQGHPRELVRQTVLRVPVPSLAPITPEKHRAAFGHLGPVSFLPIFHILHRSTVVQVILHLRDDVDHHQWAQRECCREIGNRGTELVPMRRRVQLRAVLVCCQLVLCGLETVVVVCELVALFDVALHVHTCLPSLHACGPKALPYGSSRREGVSEVHILCGREEVIV
mmetsp:Transcript_105437/g.263957  ORF Transcript_105437/g.263957 Transcript_105437/m.263957 type:complete len:269 (-) Transcript_105437:385-1191(-)